MLLPNLHMLDTIQAVVVNSTIQVALKRSMNIYIRPILLQNYEGVLHHLFSLLAIVEHCVGIAAKARIVNFENTFKGYLVPLLNTDYNFALLHS